MLIKFGYIKDTEYDEWHKDNWTVRILEGEIEGFNEPSNETPGLYAKTIANNVMLEMMLNDIEMLLE